MSASLLAMKPTFGVALRNHMHASLSREASAAGGGAAQDSYPWYDHLLGWKTLHGETYTKVDNLSHCRQIWAEGWFRNSGTQHWTDMLAILKSRRSSFVEVLSWICPGTAQLQTTSFAGRWFDQLSTNDAVLAYIQQPLTAAAHLGLPQADPATMAAYLART